ncbi:MAG: hypothetical protein JO131_00645, partial [Gammaproteobacteria bacterium]|nr:hypothetical protein [Gammaproteobacteria bacterium]
MSNPFKKNPLELEKVLEKIISRLQELGLISPNADPRELLEKTMENLKQSLGEGNLPRGELLKD